MIVVEKESDSYLTAELVFVVSWGDTWIVYVEI